jgi:cell division septum initiation protein DivIVA
MKELWCGVFIGLVVGSLGTLFVQHAGRRSPENVALLESLKETPLSPIAPELSGQKSPTTSTAPAARVTATITHADLTKLRAELTALRAENTQFEAEITKLKDASAAIPHGPAIARPAAAEEVTPLDTTAGKRVAVSGAAYVVREGGQSDILRGLHVTVIQGTVPAEFLQKALMTVVQNYKSEAADKRKQAAELRKPVPNSGALGPGATKLLRETWDEEAKGSDEKAKELEGKAQTYSQILAKVTGPVDCATALKLLDETLYCGPVIGELVDSIKIATTTTGVEGTYKFTDAPTGAYVFARFVTRDAILMWAVPVQGGGAKDLFNDTALVAR